MYSNDRSFLSSAWAISFGEQSLSVNSLLGKHDLMTDIVIQHEVGQKRQKELEQEH